MEADTTPCLWCGQYVFMFDSYKLHKKDGTKHFCSQEHVEEWVTDRRWQLQLGLDPDHPVRGLNA